MKNVSSQKKVSLKWKIIIIAFISVYLTATIYTLIIPFTLNYPISEIGTFIKKMFIVVNILSPSISYVVYLLYRPVDKALSKISNNEVLEHEEFVKANKSAENIPVFLFYVGSVSYLVGVALNFLPDFFSDSGVDFEHLIARCITAASWGLIAGVMTGRIMNIALIQSKEKLKIYDINDATNNKTASFRMNIMAPLFILFLFLFTFNSVSYYFLRKGDMQQQQQNIQNIIEKTRMNIDSDTAVKKDKSKTIFLKSLQKMITLGFVNLLTVIILAFIILTESQSKLKNLQNQLERLSSGKMDLTGRMNIVSFDDLGQITSTVNNIISNLQDAFAEIKNITANVYNTANTTLQLVSDSETKSVEVEKIINNVKNSNEKHSEILNITAKRIDDMLPVIEDSIKLISEQNEGVINTSSEVKTLIGSINSISASTLEVKELFQNLQNAVNEGEEKIQLSISAVTEIENTASEIGTIINSISSIADNTNILALNAAIQASHAGDAGKSFAVVAKEIRKLSENTNSSVTQIMQLINKMNEKTKHGVATFNDLNIILKNMINKVDTTKTALNSVTKEAADQTKHAENELRSIDKLIESSSILQDNTIMSKNKSNSLKDSMEEMKNSTDEVKNMNIKLSNGMTHLISSFDKMENNFKDTFTLIEKLESKISLFKVE